MLSFNCISCFYDVAKDPLNSIPIAYQPDLGNTIHGVGEGVVDLEAGLEAIDTTVATDGSASVATFWDIEELFNKLYDGHVRMVDVERSFYDFIILAHPARFTDETITPTYTLDSNSKLQLKLTYTFADGSTEEHDVETINEKSVHEFVVQDLANNPAVPIHLQSLGARVNSITSGRSNIFGGLRMASRPGHVLPDSFTVTYVDGDSETFVTGVITITDAWDSFYDVDGGIFFNRDYAEAFANQQGEQFEAYFDAVMDINDIETGSVRRKLKEHKQINRLNVIKDKIENDSQKQRKLQRRNNNLLGTDMDFSILTNDVAVFKLESFSDKPSEVLAAWESLLVDANANGVTKLIIDLTDNGGGLVKDYYVLLMCMFPEVDVTWFTDQWDINWNEPMTEFLEALVPLLTTLTEEFSSTPIEVSFRMRCF